MSAYPNGAHEAGVEGAVMTLKTITSWCGEVIFREELASAGEAEARLASLKSVTKLEGSVRQVETLIVNLDGAEIACRVESNQAFAFDFEGSELKGEGRAFISQRAQGNQACSELIKKF